MKKYYIALAVLVLAVAATGYVAGLYGAFGAPVGEAHNLEQENAKIQGKIEVLQEDLRIEEGRSEARLLHGMIFATIIRNRGNSGYGIRHPQDPKQQVVVKVEGNNVIIEGVGRFSEVSGRTGIAVYSPVN